MTEGVSNILPFRRRTRGGAESLDMTFDARLPHLFQELFDLSELSYKGDSALVDALAERVAQAEKERIRAVASC